jgi:hypothetical protein
LHIQESLLQPIRSIPTAQSIRYCIFEGEGTYEDLRDGRGSERRERYVDESERRGTSLGDKNIMRT